MKTLRPICLLLSGISLLLVLACGMALYVMQIGESSVQYRQSSPPNIVAQMSEASDVATIRGICLPLVRAYSAQSNTNIEQLSLWRNGLLTALCWAVLCAIMFSWIFAALYQTEQPEPAPA